MGQLMGPWTDCEHHFPMRLFVFVCGWQGLVAGESLRQVLAQCLNRWVQAHEGPDPAVGFRHAAEAFFCSCTRLCSTDPVTWKWKLTAGKIYSSTVSVMSTSMLGSQRVSGAAKRDGSVL